MKQRNTRNLVVAAMVAALYSALCLALAPLSYGMVQVRAAEALTLLPVFSPVAIWGVTLGCGVSNLVGFFTGMNVLGFLDVIFGTAATLAAAALSWSTRKIRLFGLPVVSSIPPVLVNALVIGMELTVLESGGFHPQVFLMNAVGVGLGQAVACFGLGLPLVYILEKTGVARKCFGGALEA